MDHIIEKGLPSDIDALETLYDALTGYLETHTAAGMEKRRISEKTLPGEKSADLFMEFLFMGTSSLWH